MDIKALWIFAIGVFLSFLFIIEEMITDSRKFLELTLIKKIVILCANSVIGGVVMVTVYYGLHQYFIDWNEYFIVGIAGTMAMLGKNAIHLFHSLLRQKVDEKK